MNFLLGFYLLISFPIVILGLTGLDCNPANSSETLWQCIKDQHNKKNGYVSLDSSHPYPYIISNTTSFSVEHTLTIITVLFSYTTNHVQWSNCQDALLSNPISN